MKPNQSFADEMKADKTKSRELENLPAEKQTYAKLEETPPLKMVLNF